MKKYEYNTDVDMIFSLGHGWHADIWLPGDAQISEIHLRVYSFSFPDNIYGITWGSMETKNGRLQISIGAFRPGHSKADEAVHLAVDITYYSETN
jgi:hypothetical protein